MSLTGILLDVSGSVKRNIGSGTDEEGGPWAQSIFNVIDDLIEHDLTSENRVFAIGVGAECPGKEIFDVIGTLNRPATEDQINEIFGILERNGARNIRKWACNVKQIQDVLSDYMATLTLQELKSDERFVKTFVDEFLPPSCRDTVQTASHAGGQPRTQPFNLSERSAETILISLDPRTSTSTNPDIYFQSRGAQNESWGSWLAGGVQFGLRIVANMAENATVSAVSCFRSATKEEIEEVVRKAKCYLEDSSRVLKNVETHSKFSVKDAPRILKDVGTHSIFTVQDASRIIRGCVCEKKLNELSKERRQELLENVEPFIYGGTPLYESLEKAIKLFEEDTSENKLLFVLSDGEPADGSIKDIAKINKITSKLRKVGVKIVSCFITASTNIDPKRLYDEIPPGWEPGAKFLFSLSSEVRTQDLVARAVLVKRGWKIDIAKNETKLFIQVNHPDNLRYLLVGGTTEKDLMGVVNGESTSRLGGEREVQDLTKKNLGA
jgi:predicted peroxiredoxin